MSSEDGWFVPHPQRIYSSSSTSVDSEMRSTKRFKRRRILPAPNDYPSQRNGFENRSVQVDILNDEKLIKEREKLKRRNKILKRANHNLTSVFVDIYTSYYLLQEREKKFLERSKVLRCGSCKTKLFEDGCGSSEQSGIPDITRQANVHLVKKTPSPKQFKEGTVVVTEFRGDGCSSETENMFRENPTDDRMSAKIHTDNPKDVIMQAKTPEKIINEAITLLRSLSNKISKPAQTSKITGKKKKRLFTDHVQMLEASDSEHQETLKEQRSIKNAHEKFENYDAEPTNKRNKIDANLSIDMKVNADDHPNSLESIIIGSQLLLPESNEGDDEENQNPQHEASPGKHIEIEDCNNQTSDAEPTYKRNKMDANLSIDMKFNADDHPNSLESIIIGSQLLLPESNGGDGEKKQNPQHEASLGKHIELEDCNDQTSVKIPQPSETMITMNCSSEKADLHLAPQISEISTHEKKSQSKGHFAKEEISKLELCQETINQNLGIIVDEQNELKFTNDVENSNIAHQSEQSLLDSNSVERKTVELEKSPDSSHIIPYSVEELSMPFVSCEIPVTSTVTQGDSNEENEATASNYESSVQPFFTAQGCSTGEISEECKDVVLAEKQIDTNEADVVQKSSDLLQNMIRMMSVSSKELYEKRRPSLHESLPPQ